MPPVIVPLDGSPRAETALPHARVVAAGGRLTLVTKMWDRDGVRPRLPASFVVVGTNARQGLARAVLGSVAMRVVHGAPCPVLVVRS
jgi:nucleotide-binding universal stress UspA family protein